MKCGRCGKTCAAIEVEAFGQCGRCQAKDTLDRDK